MIKPDWSFQIDVAGHISNQKNVLWPGIYVKYFPLFPQKTFAKDTDTKKAEQFCKRSTEIDTINIKVDKNIQKD